MTRRTRRRHPLLRWLVGALTLAGIFYFARMVFVEYYGALAQATSGADSN